MPFLRAGFNARSRDTGVRGWTRHVDGDRFATAELRIFAAGDFFWLDHQERPRWLEWGEKVVVGTRLDLPADWRDDYPASKLGDRPARAPGVVRIVLPYPVSANRYWRTVMPRGHGRPLTIVSDEAKDYKKQVGWRAKEAGVRSPIAGVVELRVRLVPANGVCMDLDNCLKVTLDALKGIVFGDDSQVFRITAERADPDPSGKRLEVEVLPYAVPMALEAAA